MTADREAMRHAQLMLGKLYRLVREHKIDAVGVCATLITVMQGLSRKNPKLQGAAMIPDEIEALRKIVREEMVAAVVAGANQIAQALWNTPISWPPTHGDLGKEER